MKTRRDYHKQHISKGVRYVATCETCQRAQLGEFVINRPRETFPIVVNLYGELNNAVIRKQPRYHGCQ